MSDTIRKGIIDVDPYVNNTGYLMMGNVAALSGKWDIHCLHPLPAVRGVVGAVRGVVGAVRGVVGAVRGVVGAVRGVVELNPSLVCVCRTRCLSRPKCLCRRLKYIVLEHGQIDRDVERERSRIIQNDNTVVIKWH